MTVPTSQLELFGDWTARERISDRARRIRVEVRPDGEVVLVIPRRVPRLLALAFLQRQRGWIERTRRRLRTRAPVPALGDQIRLAPAQRKALHDKARREGERLLAEEGERLGLRHRRLSVRDPRTRWGSCGADGSIMLSMRLALAPPEVFRYVVVHELCHLRWRGHGPRFWALVARQMPDYELRRRWLRDHGATLHTTIPAP